MKYKVKTCQLKNYSDGDIIMKPSIGDFYYKEKIGGAYVNAIPANIVENNPEWFSVLVDKEYLSNEIEKIKNSNESIDDKFIKVLDLIKKYLIN